MSFLRLLVVVGFIPLFLAACERGGDAPRGTPVSADGPCSGAECGSCSGCQPFESCEAGQCTCETRCTDETACLDDSCGGTCPCPDGHVQSATGLFVPQAECTDTCESSGWSCGDLCGENCGSCRWSTCELGRCVCEPRCDGTSCDDGCGGYCPCADGTVCNAAGSCVAPDQCHDTCDSEGLSCGEMCGEACGTCADGESCLSGKCVVAESCADCPLVLSLVSRRLEGGKVVSVTLAVDFARSERVPGPRMGDFRIKASKPVWLKKATAGPALVQAGKSLQPFPPWNDEFRKRTDGTFQILAYDPAGSERVETGRLATLEFSLSEWGPIHFSLVEREQTFAPPDADAAISGSGYDGDVIVTR